MSERRLVRVDTHRVVMVLYGLCGSGRAGLIQRLPRQSSKPGPVRPAAYLGLDQIGNRGVSLTEATAGEPPG